MLQCYNYSVLKIRHKKADTVAIKGKGQAVKIYTLDDGEVTINTDDFIVGEYAIQFFTADEVIEQTVLQVKQNLKYVSENFDPTTPAKKILDAINAYLAGIATHQQRRVKVGDKEIEYSSYDELMKWRQFYAEQVRKEDGKAGALRFEKIYCKGI